MYSRQKESVFFTVFNRSGLTAKGVNCVMLPYSAVFKIVPYVFGVFYLQQHNTHTKTNWLYQTRVGSSLTHRENIILLLLINKTSLISIKEPLFYWDCTQSIILTCRKSKSITTNDSVSLHCRHHTNQPIKASVYSNMTKTYIKLWVLLTRESCAALVFVPQISVSFPQFGKMCCFFSIVSHSCKPLLSPSRHFEAGCSSIGWKCCSNSLCWM